MRGKIGVLSVLAGVLCFGSVVLAGPQVLEVSPRTLDLSAYEGGANPAAQAVSIWNSGNGPMDWTVTEDCNWLTVEPNSGTSSGEVDDANIIVDINGLAEGIYSCQLTVTGSGAPNSPQVVDVNLVVIGPLIALSETQFEFIAYEGGSNPADQILGIGNIGGGTLNWEVSEDCNWLTVEPNSGTSSGELDDANIIVDINGLVEGTYNCQLTVTGSGAFNSPQLVDVDLIILDRNLVGWWRFDEGTGSTAYDSAGSNDGNLVGDPCWTSGQIDGALEFDGLDDYVSCGTGLAVPGGGTFSVSAWVRTDSAKEQAIVVQRSEATADGSYGTSILEDGRVQFWVYNGGYGFLFQSGTVTVNDGVWHHVAAVRTDPLHGEIYVDGSLAGSGVGPYRSLNNVPLWIGGPEFTGASYFDGKIDDVRVYDRALSSVEVLELYVEGLGGITSGPSPDDGATGVDVNVVLSWWAGYYAASHDVYFGTDETEVNDASTSSAEYMGNTDVNLWDPCGLDMNSTYYWRVDEVNEADVSSPWKGDVWGFRTWVEPGLIAWWKFDEGTGSTAYDSAGYNNGNVYGAVWTGGKIDGALDFNGVSDYVDMGNDSSLKPPLPVTIAGWVKLSGLEKIQRIVSIDEQSPTYYGIWLEVEATNKVRAGFGNGGDSDYYRRNKVGTTTLGAGVWYHVAAVIRGGTDISVYVSGVDDGGSCSGSAYSPAYSSGKSSIGYENGGRYYFDGAIDDVRIYDRALSGGEVMQLYADSLGGRAFCPEPYDGATGMDVNTIVVSWWAGEDAVSHDVYFGTDYNDVNDATTTSAEYMGNQDGSSWDSNNYDANGLAYWTTYYWRVDEVNGLNIWKGDVWRFRTVGNLIISGTVTSGAEPIRNLGGVMMNGLPERPVTNTNGYYEAYVGEGWGGTVSPTKTQWDIPAKVYTNVQADMPGEDYTATATECLANTHIGYGRWSNYGKPDCFCYRRQCRGDANGTRQGPYWVGSFDLAILKGAINKTVLPPGGICADFNHQVAGPYIVSSFDLTILKQYINRVETLVPECDDTHINEWKN